MAAAVQFKFPPKKINHFYGYRTKTSMRNQQTWDFAQQFSALEMIRTSIVMVVLGGLSWGFDFSPPYPMASALALTVLFPLVMVLKIEKELKKRFSEDS